VTHSQRTKNSETSHGRRSFLKLLGLGGVAAATTAAGGTVLGGTVKKLTEEEGTLWKTETFDGDLFVPADWAKGANEILEENMAVAELAHRDFHPDAPGRVCVLSTSGDYSQGYSKSMTWFGRTPKIGELVRFRGADPTYTVIEVTEGKGNKWHNVLLDRPLELDVKDRTTVYKEGSVIDRKLHGHTMIARDYAEMCVDGGVIYGAFRLEWREDRPFPYNYGWSRREMEYWRDTEYPLDLSVECDYTAFKGMKDVHELIKKGECDITFKYQDDEYRFETAALFGSLAVNWGGRTVTAEEDALSDAVVQDGADRGLYSQELADEFIGLTTPEGDIALESSDESVTEGQLVLESPDLGTESEVVESVSNRPPADPIEAVLRFDWSKALDDLLDEGIEVHCHPYAMRSGDVINRMIAPELRIKRPEDEREFDVPVKTEQLKLEHFYVAFIIQDSYAAMGMEEVVRCFFEPALYSIAIELNLAAKVKDNQLWVAPLPTMAAASHMGVKQVTADGGRVPVRVSMEYDVCCQGTKVTFDFLAHYPE
jgi:hypothetical protein